MAVRGGGRGAGYWDDQGWQSQGAASEAKARRQAEAKAKAAAAEQKARQMWLQWSVKAAPRSSRGQSVPALLRNVDSEY